MWHSRYFFVNLPSDSCYLSDDGSRREIMTNKGKGRKWRKIIIWRPLRCSY